MIQYFNPNPNYPVYQPIPLVRSVFILLGCVMFMASCTSSKNITYFGNISDSSKVALPVMQVPRAVIMPDDLLEIKISGANEVTAALFNSYSTNVSNSPAASAATPYLVDDDGEVEFPIIGKVKAAGLTRDAFKELLKSRVSKYLKDPLVSVRFVNFRFTVLGEVKTPGSFVIPNEKVTVLEAMGLAGDMTSYGKRNNVKIIRDSSGRREIGTINFNDKNVFSSQYYYLHRNDVLYIEPVKNKSRFEDISRVSAVIATLASLVAIAITVFR
jgi:polysaccharide biosynthesis/export protein